MRTRFRREWLLIVAFLVIAGMVAWKLTRPPQQSPSGTASAGEFFAPPFQLHDHRSRMVRLAAFQGRHPVLVVFYVASAPDQHPLLADLRKRFKDFEQRDIKIIGISAATPYMNREAFKKGGDFPFPLLSDPTLQAHRTWNAFDTERTQPRQAAFVIDRRGVVRWYKADPDLPKDASLLVEQFDALK